MTIIFFFINVQSLTQFPEIEQRDQKKFSFWKIIAFEPESTNSHKAEQVTCHWQSICYQATLTFRITLKEVHSKAGSLGVMKKYAESHLKHILQEFGTL